MNSWTIEALFSSLTVSWTWLFHAWCCICCVCTVVSLLIYVNMVIKDVGMPVVVIVVIECEGLK